MLFGWKVLKHVKSNGILIVKDNTTVGVGAGQVSRVDSVDIAMNKSGESIKDSILCSDAFFPFRDSIDKIAGSGIKAVLQPGGSVRDRLDATRDEGANRVGHLSGGCGGQVLCPGDGQVRHLRRRQPRWGD